jgi:putative transposase
VKYACIARHYGEFPVRLMCRVLSVCASGFYAWRKRAPSARAQQDKRLLLEVRVAHEESRETYGAPRVHRELRAQGTRVGKKRVARLMQEDGLVVRRSGHYVHTTDSNHAYPLAPNLLDRHFAVTEIGRLDRVWVSDITYVPTREGWLYLASVLDLGSRRCVGWAMRDTLEADLTLSALRMAIATRRPAAGLMHHSDRGSQYACTEYRGLLATHGMVASMSRKGNCWDNAVAESFFSTLEFELIMKNDWHTREEARREIFRYIETWYNRKRRHSALDYVSPAEYERHLQLAA